MPFRHVPPRLHHPRGCPPVPVGPGRVARLGLENPHAQARERLPGRSWRLAAWARRRLAQPDSPALRHAVGSPRPRVREHPSVSRVRPQGRHHLAGRPAPCSLCHRIHACTHSSRGRCASGPARSRKSDWVGGCSRGRRLRFSAGKEPSRRERRSPLAIPPAASFPSFLLSTRGVSHTGVRG